MARISLFSAAAAAGGYILAAVPNVELLTAIVALGALSLGIGSGITIAIIASLVYFGFNGWGVSNPPLLLSQVLGIGVTGLVFGLLRVQAARFSRLVRMVVFGFCGSLTTLVYDLLTNLSWPLATGVAPGEGWIPYLMTGIIFSVVHIVSNAVIFAVVVPVAYERIPGLMPETT